LHDLNDSAFLPKPFDLNALLDAVATALGRSLPW
jgi:FixJ family two-component response regulator